MPAADDAASTESSGEAAAPVVPVALKRAGPLG